MARYVQVSTDIANKTILDGPIAVDPASVPAVPTGRQWMTESAARSAGYSYPAVALSVEETNAADLRGKAQQALTANATYLALASPTNAQTTQQVQRLTRETSALIRLALGLLDSTDGT